MRRFASYFLSLGVSFIVFWLIMFMMTFASSMTGPAVPYLIEDFLKEEAVVVMMIGMLSSLFNLVRTAVNLPGGFLADKFGRKKLILISLFLFPVSYLCFIVSNNVYWLFAGNFVAGICFGLISPAINALVADVVPEASRATLYGVFNLSWIISQIPAPLIGGFLAELRGIKFPFMIAFAFSCATPMLLLKVIKKLGETKPVKEKSEGKKQGEEQNQPPGYRRVLSLFCGMNILTGLGNGILITIFYAYLMYKLGISIFEMGLAFSIGWGISTAIVQIPGGKIADKFGRKPLILVSSITTAPLIIFLALTGNLIQFVILLALICIVGNLSAPAYSAWLMDYMPG